MCAGISLLRHRLRHLTQTITLRSEHDESHESMPMVGNGNAEELSHHLQIRFISRTPEKIAYRIGIDSGIVHRIGTAYHSLAFTLNNKQITYIKTSPLIHIGV